MTLAAFRLVLVVTVAPLLPLVISLTWQWFGVATALLLTLLWYVGYPLFFGALMWRHLTPEKSHG
jgi:hypothetical protein